MKKSPKKKKLLKKITSIRELENLAEIDKSSDGYRKLAMAAASNLGFSGTTLEGAIQWLKTNAMETDEKGIVSEINFCRDLIIDEPIP